MATLKILVAQCLVTQFLWLSGTDTVEVEQHRVLESGSHLI